MVKHCGTQKNDASVGFLTPAAIVHDQTQHEARISWVRLFHCLGTVFVNESTNNKLRMRERVEWMVCHSELWRLLHAIINFLNLSDEGSSPKESTCTVLESYPVFQIVFVCIVLHHQCCAALSYIATPESICSLCCVAEILSVKR